jgi:hypothetical protein
MKRAAARRRDSSSTAPAASLWTEPGESGPQGDAGGLRCVRSAATLNQQARVFGESLETIEAELGEHVREHRAAFERGRSRIQEHDLARTDAAEPAAARMGSAESSATNLYTELLDSPRELLEHTLLIHSDSSLAHPTSRSERALLPGRPGMVWSFSHCEVRRRWRERCALPRGHFEGRGNHVPTPQKDILG